MPTRLNAQQLRKSKMSDSQKIAAQVKRNPIGLVLDNIQDTYNIGSFFRLADALAVEKVYLCGQVVLPPNIKIHRASIGTWKFVPWENHYSILDCLTNLKKSGYQLIACDQSSSSINYQKANYQFPVAIIAGNESAGIGESVLKLCDIIAEIPMYGINKSLNTLVATSIIAYEVINHH